MPAPSDRLRGTVANRAASDAAPVPAEGTGKPPTIWSMIDRQKSHIAQILPKHMDADRLAKVVATVIRANPKLLECTPASLLGASMISAQVGLEPGPLGECYWVPFWNRNAEWTDPETGRARKGAFEVTWIMGYKGIMSLARRSGQLLSIAAHAVYSNDLFEFEYGLDEKLRHVPAEGDRGELRRFYCVARFRDGGHYIRVMSVADVEAHRSRSRSKDNGPWVTDYVAMGCKTVIRASAPFLPLSVDFMRATIVDEQVTQGPVSLEDAGFAIPTEQPAELVAPTPPEDVERDPNTGEVVGGDEGPQHGAATEPPVDTTPPAPDASTPPPLADDGLPPDNNDLLGGGEWPATAPPGSKGKR